MKIFLGTIILTLTCISAKAEMDTVAVFDFSSEWMFYDGRSQLPLVRKSDFKGNVIVFEFDKTEWPNTLLSIQYSKPFSLFIDDNLYSSGLNDITLDWTEIDSRNHRVVVTVFSEGLNPYYLKTQAFKLVTTSLDPLSDDVVIVEHRDRDAFHDFFILASIILLVYFTVLITYYPRSLSEYFRFTRAISPRELDENLLKTRPFTGINISIYVYISLILALLIYSIVHLSNLFPEELHYYPDSAYWGIWYWLRLSAIILAFIFLKYILITIFSNLFVVNDFVQSHFYNSLRLLFMLTTTLMLFTGALYYGFVNNQSTIYYSIYSILLYSLPMVSLIIYLKLMNSSGYKNLHLFSYLCGTELIPYVIILSLGIN